MSRLLAEARVFAITPISSALSRISYPARPLTHVDGAFIIIPPLRFQFSQSSSKGRRAALADLCP